MASLAYQIQAQQLTQISHRVPIKNSHLFTHILVHQENILLLTSTTIQIHSIANIMQQLPSLMEIIDIQQHLHDDDNKDNQVYHKDQLTQRLTETHKKNLGEQIFTDIKDSQSNRLLDGQLLRGRLTYLNAQNANITHIFVSHEGRILIQLSDRRALYFYQNILTKKKKLLPTSINPQQKQTKSLKLHQILKSKIYLINFTITHKDLIVMTQQKQHINFYKLQIDHRNGKITQKYQIGHKKDLTLIKNTSILSLHYLENLHNNSQQNLLILFHIDSIEILCLSSNTNKTKTITITSKKYLNILPDTNKQYIDNIYIYENIKTENKQDKPPMNARKKSKEKKKKDNQSHGDIYSVNNEVYFYMENTSGIWRWDVNRFLKNQGRQERMMEHLEQQDHSKNGITKLNKHASTQPKSSIAFINFLGGYSQNINNQYSLATQSQNGLLIKLLRTSINYKDGSLIIYVPHRKYIIQKLFSNIIIAYHRQRVINYRDIQLCLKVIPSIKKQILEQLTKVNKQIKQTVRSNQFVEVYKEGNPYEGLQINQQLINIVIANILDIFQSKPVLAEKIKVQCIKKKLNNEEITGEDFQNKCYFSGRNILFEDVMYCHRCKMYAIKEEIKQNQQYCYICWHQLIQI